MTAADPALGLDAEMIANQLVDLGAEFQGVCVDRRAELTGEEAFKEVQRVMAALSALYSALYPVRELARQHWADETRPRQVAS